MLFILTGNIQIGKTRWLQQLIADLQEQQIPCYGVVAPGVWRRRRAGELPSGDMAAGLGDYEKLGIDNQLLPSGELIHFAQRSDLARADGTFNAKSQSAQAQLSWEISDDAIAQVNAHFCSICAQSKNGCIPPEIQKKLAEREGREYVPQPEPVPGLLVVDELGRLELLRGEGLTSAMDVLMQGPTYLYKHALIVVREQLLDYALQNFDGVWGEILPISPDNDARTKIFQSVAN